LKVKKILILLLLLILFFLVFQNISDVQYWHWTLIKILAVVLVIFITWAVKKIGRKTLIKVLRLSFTALLVIILCAILLSSIIEICGQLDFQKFWGEGLSEKTDTITFITLPNLKLFSVKFKSKLYVWEWLSLKTVIVLLLITVFCIIWAIKKRQRGEGKVVEPIRGTLRTKHDGELYEEDIEATIELPYYDNSFIFRCGVFFRIEKSHVMHLLKQLETPAGMEVESVHCTFFSSSTINPVMIIIEDGKVFMGMVRKKSDDDEIEDEAVIVEMNRSNFVDNIPKMIYAQKKAIEDEIRRERRSIILRRVRNIALAIVFLGLLIFMFISVYQQDRRSNQYHAIPSVSTTRMQR
jgi:hypothetical protein